MSLPFHPDAEREVSDAVDWYAARSPPQASRFNDAIDQAQNDIAAAPQLYSPADDAPAGYEVRNYLLPRFPYRVVYWVRPSGIVVLAVAHLHRRPGYWQGRLTPNSNP